MYRCIDRYDREGKITDMERRSVSHRIKNKLKNSEFHIESKIELKNS